MPWPCVMYEQHPDEPRLFRKRGDMAWDVMYHQLPIGAMWFDEDELSVIVPRFGQGSVTKQEWNIDRGRKLNAKKGSRDLPQWEWTGQPPNITATPSIHCLGTYHGFLRDGVLTDDLDGRKAT